MVATTHHYLFHYNDTINNIMSIPTSIGNNLNKIIVFKILVYITITTKRSQVMSIFTSSIAKKLDKHYLFRKDQWSKLH
jgi:hypothetical protein